MPKKTYKYPKNWFKHNLIAVPADFANCSACIFRGTNYCLDGYLRCTYLNEGTDEMMSVHWVGAETHANIALWTELVNFFNNTPKHRIRQISNDIMTAVVLKYKESAR